jgi:Kef-type K+ transport system membrane component KefB
METIINWLKGLSRNAKIALIIAVAIFTPVVGIALSIVFTGISAVFTVLGFVFGFVNWGVAFLLILAFAGYKVYVLFKDGESTDEEEDLDAWDPFR